MMEIDFKKIELEDKNLMQPYFDRYPGRSCERTFANIFLWSRRYPVSWALLEGALVIKSRAEGELAFAYPAGEPEQVKKAVDTLLVYSKEKDQPLSFFVTEEQFEELNSFYPERFQVEYNRDDADYVYESEKLATLSGKKLHGKRNHINKFKKIYEGRWTYEAMSKDNLEDCFQMQFKWRAENDGDQDQEKRDELCVLQNGLRLFDELDLIGGVLRVDGKVVAFCFGEALCSDTFVVHFEKALTEIEGAYTMINQQFVEHACMDFAYVNREEDTGLEGLRQAKMSYRPAFLVQKGVATVKNI